MKIIKLLTLITFLSTIQISAFATCDSCGIVPNFSIEELSDCRLVIIDQTEYDSCMSMYSHIYVDYGNGQLDSSFLGDTIPNNYTHGTYTMCITAHGYSYSTNPPFYCSKTICKTVRKRTCSNPGDPGLGRLKFKSENDFAFAYPNPAINTLFIDVILGVENIQILSLNGQTVFNEEITSSNSIKIDINDLSPGIYFVRSKRGDEFSTQKIIVK